MNTRLKSTLETAIQQWMNMECESDEWDSLDVFVPDELVVLMATSAEAVFDAVVDTNKYLKREELLKS